MRPLPAEFAAEWLPEWLPERMPNLLAALEQHASLVRKLFELGRRYEREHPEPEPASWYEWIEVGGASRH